MKREEVVEELRRRLAYRECTCGGDGPGMYSCGHCVATAAIAGLAIVDEQAKLIERMREQIQRTSDSLEDAYQDHDHEEIESSVMGLVHTLDEFLRETAGGGQ